MHEITQYVYPTKKTREIAKCFSVFPPLCISETRAVLHGLLNFCYAGFYTLFQGCIPGCGDCELGLPKYFKIPIFREINFTKNFVKMISRKNRLNYSRCALISVISTISWTREKRLQANQLFSSNISMYQFRKEFLMFMNIHHQYQMTKIIIII